jgi:hypothetical protein
MWKDLFYAASVVVGAGVIVLSVFVVVAIVLIALIRTLKMRPFEKKQVLLFRLIGFIRRMENWANHEIQYDSSCGPDSYKVGVKSSVDLHAMITNMKSALLEVYSPEVVGAMFAAIDTLEKQAKNSPEEVQSPPIVDGNQPVTP